MAYELVIGDKNVSSWSLRPWLAMKHANIPFREINIKLRTPQTKAEILRHSPAGKVPALLVGGKEGKQVIWDSLAILEYLAETHPEAKLWPQSQPARAHARSAAAEMHAGFQALREHCPMDLVRRLPKASLPDPVSADVRRIIGLWKDCRGRYGAGGAFLFGAFSAADAMYAPVASRFRTYLPDLAGYGDDGTAQTYVDMLFALPTMIEWEAAAQLDPKPG
jgi:glutathione S-transferase